MAETSWGNPVSTNFRKNNIREAKIGDTAVAVHALIRPMVERMLAMLNEAGLDTSAVRPVGDPTGLGFILDVPVSKQVLEHAEVAALSLGFEYHDHGQWVFAASASWAKAKGEELAAADQAEVSTTFTPEPVDGDRPGSRELTIGDEGLDVKTLQLFVRAAPTGVFDEATARALRDYQTHHGLSGDGAATRDFWLELLPRKIMWRRMGDGGRDIRLLQAALSAFGYMPAEQEVTARYGMVMNRAVRALRDEKGMRGATKIDSLVWTSLFSWGLITLPPRVMGGRQA
jgi:peptidoglycan hydrolase-like protein with peptidoglycan-binding domain